MSPWIVLYAALINWVATTVFVEASLFEPYRSWVIRRAERVATPTGLHKLPYVWPEGTTEEQASNPQIVYVKPWGKVAQLITCHLCLGTWVGFIEAAVFGGPFHGWYAIIANGLLFKAGGHLILELRSKIAK